MKVKLMVLLCVHILVDILVEAPCMFMNLLGYLQASVTHCFQ
jgi:hypothetical protein